jgi:tetratricopeptide (TPR) repeat protein
MKFIFTLILTLSINLSVSSQEDSINFFKTLLKTEIKPESQVQILINLSRLNSLNHPDSSLIYANRAIIKAKEANFKKGLAHSFFIKGKAIESEKDYKKAIELFLLCSESFSKLKMIPNIAKSYHRLGFNYYKTGNNDSSLIYLEKALTLFDNKKNPSNVADAKRLMALSYWSMGNYAKGITSINSALQQFISLQDSNQIALCHNTKGAILWGLTDYENALKNFFEALSIRVATHDKEDKIIITILEWFITTGQKKMMP